MAPPAGTGAGDYRRGVLLVALGALLFSPDSLLIRLVAMEQWPTLFWRGLIGGGAITLALALAYGRRYPAKLRALRLHGIGFALAFSATSFCFIFAVRETSVGNSLFIISASPVFSALISWVALGERPDRRTLRTIVIALAGVGLIAFGGDKAGGPNSLAGDLAALGAAFFLATSFVISRSARPRDMTPMLGPAAMATALVASFMVTDFTVPAGSWPPLLVMGLLVMPVGTSCLATGPRLIPAVEVSLLLLIEAVAGPLIVWWALSEYPGDMTLVGGAMILSALAWSGIEGLRAR